MRTVKKKKKKKKAELRDVMRCFLSFLFMNIQSAGGELFDMYTFHIHC